VRRHLANAWRRLRIGECRRDEQHRRREHRQNAAHPATLDRVGSVGPTAEKTIASRRHEPPGADVRARTWHTRAVTELDRVRTICLGLPEVTERLSHGSPTWFVRGKKTFVTYHDDHHGDGRLALWCAAPAGMQEALVAGEPDHYFRPPYVGHRGWLGVHLDRGLDWNEIAGAIEDAYAEIAPKSLVEQARAAREHTRRGP
jgi:hypothetical protein